MMPPRDVLFSLRRTDDALSWNGPRGRALIAWSSTPPTPGGSSTSRYFGVGIGQRTVRCHSEAIKHLGNPALAKADIAHSRGYAMLAIALAIPLGNYIFLVLKGL
jgi:hypothetical protein